MEPSQTYIDYFEAETKRLSDKGYLLFGIHQNSIVMSASLNAANDLGYSIDELLGMNAWALFDSSSYEEVATKLFEHQNSEYIVTLKRKDSSSFNASLYVLDTSYKNEPVRVVYYKKSIHSKP